MEATATCAFCGAEAPQRKMDMTGNGWRCAACAVRSDLAVVQGRPAGMAEHLTPGELEEVVKQGGQEAVLGALLGVGGLAGTLLSIAAGGQIVIVFSGAMIAGFGMVGHGLYRRKQARAALQHLPGARVISR
jgi:1-deoxy-D-xylulose 5-phosphate reductoisomerase